MRCIVCIQMNYHLILLEIVVIDLFTSMCKSTNTTVLEKYSIPSKNAFIYISYN